MASAGLVVCSCWAPAGGWFHTRCCHVRWASCFPQHSQISISPACAPAAVTCPPAGVTSDTPHTTAGARRHRAKSTQHASRVFGAAHVRRSLVWLVVVAPAGTWLRLCTPAAASGTRCSCSQVVAPQRCSMPGRPPAAVGLPPVPAAPPSALLTGRWGGPWREPAAS